MLKILTFAVSLVFVASMAAAEPRLGVCASDLKQHCGGVQPGGGRLVACAKQHLNDLSEACKARLANVAAVARACAADVKQNCASAGQGRVRIASCLRSSLSNLSDACKGSFISAVVGRK